MKRSKRKELKARYDEMCKIMWTDINRMILGGESLLTKRDVDDMEKECDRICMQLDDDEI